MVATFKNKKTGRTKQTRFGQQGYEDFTVHKDKSRKQSYINRHKKNENWNDPTKPGTLAKYLLWNKETLTASIQDYKNKFF